MQSRITLNERPLHMSEDFRTDYVREELKLLGRFVAFVLCSGVLFFGFIHLGLHLTKR